MQPTDTLKLKGEFTVKRPELLLHTCCGPCLANFLKFFKNSFDVQIFWFNPNIHGVKEFKKRKDVLTRYCSREKLKIIYDNYYSIKGFVKKIEKEEVRCNACYKWRMERTAKAAKEKGIRFFSTTLLTSPMQKHQKIIELGEELAEKYGLIFIIFDIRDDYDGNLLKKDGYYTQAFCGCIFSEEDRYL